MTNYATETTDLIPTLIEPSHAEIAQSLREQGLTRKQIAAEMGVGVTSVHHYLNGGRDRPRKPEQTAQPEQPDRPPLVELDEFEIVRRYGEVMWNGLIAMSMDLRYAAEMVEAANLIEHKREQWKARREGTEYDGQILHKNGRRRH